MMVCCSPIHHFVANNSIAGQSFRVFDVARALGLSFADLDRLWLTFISYEPNERGLIHIETVFKLQYDIECGPFLRNYMRMFDTSKCPDGEIGFEGWMVAIWNFLTTNEKTMGQFTFDFLDLKDNKIFTVDILTYMIKIIWGQQNFDENKLLSKTIDSVEVKKNGDIPLANIIKVVEAHSMLLFPLYMAQEVLRSMIFSRRFWQRLRLQRTFDHQISGIFEICDHLYDEMFLLHFLDSLDSVIRCPVQLHSEVTYHKDQYLANKRSHGSEVVVEDVNQKTRTKNAEDMKSRKAKAAPDRTLRRRLTIHAENLLAPNKYQVALDRTEIPKQFMQQAANAKAKVQAEMTITRRISKFIDPNQLPAAGRKKQKPPITASVDEEEDPNKPAKRKKPAAAGGGGGGVVKRMSLLVVNAIHRKKNKTVPTV